MTHVVTESCIKCRYTDCVDVCPVDCFREGPNFLAIDPDECIDCAVCVAECPVNAIYAEEDVPGDQQNFIELNADLAKNWPSITKTKAPLPEALSNSGQRFWLRVPALKSSRSISAIRLAASTRVSSVDWRTPVQMDNARLIEVLGREPHTPLDEAVEAALRL